MMENIMREAIRLIVEASIMCCTQIDSNKFSRFFSILINKNKLDKFGEHDMYKQITTHLDIPIICERISVGIQDSVKEVIDLLEWGSEKISVAVIFHNLGVMG
uniref:Uncharacterized protein n=1 Tax=Picea sitchensis TaxID=3332 RepID=B8LM33_PICSI|nr:unknown [Picea sitchensis]